MMGWRVMNLCRCIRALASAFAIAIASSPVGADDAAGPAWLRAPLDRGPVAASLGIDTDHVWWGIDGAMSLGSQRELTGAASRRVLGLGLSVAGQGGSDPNGLRYSAVVDRRSQRNGAWFGLSTGGGGQTMHSRLQIGTGMWRSFALVEIDGAVVSSFVQSKGTEASHWGFFRDSLHWRDTTTYHSYDRSGVWHTAQSALRWRHGRMELTAIGGISISQRIEPFRWAQAVLNVQATRTLMFMAAYGQRPPASMAFDPSAHPQTMVGVQFAPWATSESASTTASRTTSATRARDWNILPAGNGQTRIRVRCPGVTRVEISGDFTDWAPVALTSVGDGRWETTLSILPGLHQVQIRFDGGEWQVPPGLPSTQREFAGAAGVLLIEEAP
jgi:hypothetical protein